jgi:acetyltransferase
MDDHTLPRIIVLADGTRVRVRPIRPDDARRMQAFATRLSQRTIFLRTNMVRPASLSDAEAAYATQVDYRSSMALIALIGTEPDDRIIAVARYASIPAAPGQAEVGITVEDGYQGQGLGARVLLHLAEYARDRGISSLVANVTLHNRAVMSAICRTGLPVEYLDSGPGEYQVILSLRQRAGTERLAIRAGDIFRPLLRLAWNVGAGLTPS